MDSGFGNDVRVQSVAEVDRVDVVTDSVSVILRCVHCAYHSKSLYMIVKKTWRKRLTAFMSTANRYSHASPDMTGKRVSREYSSILHRTICRADTLKESEWYTVVK